MANFNRLYRYQPRNTPILNVNNHAPQFPSGFARPPLSQGNLPQRLTFEGLGSLRKISPTDGGTYSQSKGKYEKPGGQIRLNEFDFTNFGKLIRQRQNAMGQMPVRSEQSTRILAAVGRVFPQVPRVGQIRRSQYGDLLLSKVETATLRARLHL